MPSAPDATRWRQGRVTLRARPRGIHLVTREIVEQMPEISSMSIGLAHVFIRHTSASLTLNENASPDVRTDLEEWLRRAAPDETTWFRHDDEGPDDMPAHIKAALMGTALTIPIADGRLQLGTWQGIYLCEHRVQGGPRTLTVTVFGESERAPT